MQPSISTAVADYLLQHLTSLRSVKLDVVEPCDDQLAWKPAADLGSMDGSMVLTSTVQVDCSGLSSAAKLKQLTLRPYNSRDRLKADHNLLNLAALSSLTSLQTLSIDPIAEDAIPATWSSLQLLRTLHARLLPCSAEAWCALASLTLLEDIYEHSLDIDASAAAAATLKKVHVVSRMWLLHSPQH